MRPGGQPPTRSNEDVLVGYVEAALADIEAGREPDLAAICAHDPHLVAAVAEALGCDRTMARPAAVAQRAPLVGRVLAGRYELGDCVGLGAMGAVHRATDRSLDRHVAVKVMHAGLFPDASRQARFVREAKVLAALADPAVVPIHDHGRSEDGLFFLVMDLLDGVSLATVLRAASESALPMHVGDWAAKLGLDVAATERTFARQVAAWGVQLARGLAAAHAAGIVHRDVKPSNVFLTRRGCAVLLDFGIAARQGDGALTAADSTLGTPWYMAPEQAVSGDTARPAVDVYGLGATLYHLLTLQPPYTGEPADVLYKLRTADPPPPQALRPELPRDLGAIVEKALDRDPRRRYATMAAMAADLEAFLDHRPVVARPVTRTARAVRAVRRRPARAIAVVAVAAALPLAVLTWWLVARSAAVAAHRQAEELRAEVPALVCLEGYPDKRLLEDMTESAQAIGLLTRILELEPGDVCTRLMRASLHLDRGERSAAVADVEAISRLQPSPYTDALARAFASASDSVRGARALRTTHMPAPGSDIDWFLAGFQTLRLRQDYATAHEQLGRAIAFPAARDLRMLTWLMLATEERDPAERRRKFETARAEALTLEGVYGRKTARTRHTIGAAMVGLKQYELAIEPLRESLAIRPHRHGPLHNLGIAYRRLHRLDEAEACLREANELRPWLWNTLLTLAQVQCDRGGFDAALQFAERIPASGSMGEEWQRPLLIARVHLNHAFALLRGGDREAAKAPAALALQGFDACLVHEFAGKAAAGLERDLARSLAEGATATDVLVGSWRSEFTNPVMIQNLEVLLAQEQDRGTPSPDVLFAVRVYLLRLAQDLAPDDPGPRDRFRMLMQERK